MTINYEVKADDLMEYQIFCFKTIPTLKKAYHDARISYSILFVTSLIVAILMPNNFSIAFYIMAILFLSVLLMNTVFLLFMVKKSMRNHINNGFMDKAMGNKTIELFPETYIINSPDYLVKVSWERVESIYITPTHVFLFDNPVMAHLIPKRSFESAELWGIFTASLQKYSDKVIVTNAI